MARFLFLVNLMRSFAAAMNRKTSLSGKNKIGVRGYQDRLVGIRTKRKRFLIVCEGEKTEPYYFKSFPITTRPEIVQVDIVPGACESVSLVEMAIHIRDRASDPYDSVWVVMDREDPNTLSAGRFNEAIHMAEHESIQVAYSNESFELWYLLHFNYIETALSRSQYSNMLFTCLGKKYQKNSKTMYEDILHKQSDAIRNAKRLLAQYVPRDPERDNPSTTVFELVEELNRYLPGC